MQYTKQGEVCELLSNPEVEHEKSKLDATVFLACPLLFLLILAMAFLSSFLAKARSVVCAAVTSA